MLKASKHSFYFCTILLRVLINIYHYSVHEISVLHTIAHTLAQTTAHIHKHKHRHKHIYNNHWLSSTVRTRCKQSVIFFQAQHQFYSVVPWHRLLVVDHTPRRGGFSSSPVCVGFMVVKSGGVGLSPSTTVLNCHNYSTVFLFSFSLLSTVPY